MDRAPFRGYTQPGDAEPDAVELAGMGEYAQLLLESDDPGAALGDLGLHQESLDVIYADPFDQIDGSQRWIVFWRRLALARLREINQLKQRIETLTAVSTGGAL